MGTIQFFCVTKLKKNPPYVPTFSPAATRSTGIFFRPYLWVWTKYWNPRCTFENSYW